MPKFLKYALYALLLVILLSGGFLWWQVTHTEGYKKNASEMVAMFTDRTLTINGPLEINIESLLSRTTIVLNDFSLSNAPWAGDLPMLECKRLSITIDPSKFLSKQIAIYSIEIDGLRLRLDKNEEGEANWDIAVDVPPSSDEGPTISIDKIHLTDFKGSYDSPDRESPLDIVLDQLGLERQTDDKIAIDVTGVFAEQNLSISGAAGPLLSLAEGGHALVGCTTHPGFEFEDFELGERDELLGQWPEHEAIIKKLTPST